MNNNIPKRFKDEKIADHWLVTEDKTTFDNLMQHLQVKTHFYFGFMQSLSKFFELKNENNLVIADIGGGVGWSTAILANNPRIKKIYLVEPSLNRVKSFKNICNHLNVPSKKVEFINGSFQDFKLPEKVDVILMCAAIHHCHVDYLDELFKNIETSLVDPNKKASIIISNEHYVNFVFSIFRFMKLILNLLKGKETYWSFFNLRHYDPKDHEHWRTKRELISIFKNYNYNYKIFKYNVDICNDKPLWKRIIAWQYYFAILGK